MAAERPPCVLGSRRWGSGLCRSILCSRKSNFLREIALSSPRQAVLVVGSETRLAAELSEVVQTWCFFWSHEAILSSYFRGDTHRILLSRPSLTGFQLLLLEKKTSSMKSLWGLLKKVKCICSRMFVNFFPPSNNYTTGQWCRMELPCGRIKTDAGLFLAFLWTWHPEAIYDDDISIPSHSWPIDLVSTALQAANCNLVVSMVSGYLCIKAYRVKKHLARKRMHVGQQLWKAVKLNKSNFKKSFYNCVITDVGWWRHLVENREDKHGFSDL